MVVVAGSKQLKGQLASWGFRTAVLKPPEQKLYFSNESPAGPMHYSYLNIAAKLQQ